MLVGRQEELAVLDGARRALAQSQGSMVLVGGEPGIGKTRLIAQFMRSAAEGRSRNLATAECLERAQQPFGPIRTFLEAFEQAASAVERPANVRTAQRQLAPSGQPAHEAAGTETITALEKAQLFPALASFFKLVADKRATVAAIEDIQWADASTLDFLTFFVPQIATMRLMLIATYRSDYVEGNAPLTKALARLLREAHVHHIVLEPLSRGDVRTLMADALSDLSLPVTTKRDIEERCDGNPFFAEELLKSAIARPTSGDAPLPLSIRATIMERLSTFTEDERRVLAHAAVLGYRFDPTLLAIVMQRDIDALLPTLRRARDLQIIIEECGERALCRFRHALTRRTIYDDMLGFDARRMHEQILSTLETLGDAPKHIDELAYHAWEAKDARRSLSYNERAGETALALGALPEAATNFERALKAATDAGDRARLLTRCGAVAEREGRFGDAIALCEKALELHLDRNEYHEAATLIGWIVGDGINLGDTTGLARGQRFMIEFGDRLSAPERNKLAVYMAKILSTRHDFVPVEQLLSDVRPLELPSSQRQNYILTQMNRHTYRGDVAAWKHSVTDFYGFANTVLEFMRLIGFYTIAQAGTHVAAHAETRRALDDGDRLAARCGSPAAIVFGTSVRAVYLWSYGELVAARRCVEEVLTAGEPYVARLVAACIAPLLALALDDDTLVVRSLTDDVAKAVGAGDWDAARLCGARGTWLANQGRLAEARRDLRSGLNTIRAAAPFCTTLLVSCARYLEERDLMRVTELTDPSKLHPEDAVGRATASLVAAIIAQRRDNAAEAERLAAAAAQMYTALGWPMFEAQSLEVAGRSAEALALYERCGAIADVRRLALPASGRTADDDKGPLSPREEAIADLVTLGFTNAEIAERLSVSPKTIEKHLASIFAKLGIRSRAQIAAFITTNSVNARELPSFLTEGANARGQ
ncbi:MAG: AAA family ATPase [Candidatus Eremiobacteraeota bacterium]|nr:AAA family ATPase [Candidatus Eremiobacteraeota bacterium]MBC5820526.1 AAA family ATPase [Candidatus Eremiobacteraeota bacterium]